ncbi:hypothetical protein LCGC14_1157720 [marine sediment metagenome]|uniref:Uncharacterized protein n=1 Tax=marine sediment metagenome TaxID=412755 RepID=A0A0F9MGP9_9ZZZZ
MEYRIVVARPGHPPSDGTLTTIHPQSSYGIPVAVVDGVAYGTAEVLWVDSNKEGRAAAAKAGYTVLSDEDSGWHIRM